MLTKGHIIEFAKPADAAAISGISRREIEYGLRAVYTPIRVRAAIQDASTNVVTARINGKLIAFAIMRYGATSANLDLLAVKRGFRRQGVGSALLSWLVEVACTAGISTVFVQVRRGNSSALKFYRTLDFHAIEELAGYYQGRDHAVIMSRGIRPIFERS